MPIYATTPTVIPPVAERIFDIIWYDEIDVQAMDLSANGKVKAFITVSKVRQKEDGSYEKAPSDSALSGGSFVIEDVYQIAEQDPMIAQVIGSLIYGVSKIVNQYVSLLNYENTEAVVWCQRIHIQSKDLKPNGKTTVDIDAFKVKDLPDGSHERLPRDIIDTTILNGGSFHVDDIFALVNDDPELMQIIGGLLIVIKKLAEARGLV